MRIPLGVITHDDDTYTLVYETAEVPAALWRAADLEKLGNPCSDGDCIIWGCICTSVSETYHCSHCADAVDIGYQCDTYARMCVNCCGHARCLDAWLLLVDAMRFGGFGGTLSDGRYID